MTRLAITILKSTIALLVMSDDDNYREMTVETRMSSASGERLQ